MCSSTVHATDTTTSVTLLWCTVYVRPDVHIVRSTLSMVWHLSGHKQIVIILSVDRTEAMMGQVEYRGMHVLSKRER